MKGKRKKNSRFQATALFCIVFLYSSSIKKIAHYEYKSLQTPHANQI